MNKKGFTLIELLATVIILSIVLLIAVPRVLNVIENNRKKAFIASILSYSSSTRAYLDSKLVNNEYTYPKDNRYSMFDVSNLDIDDNNKYSGNIAIIKNSNNKVLHAPYMTDGKYYVCGVFTEEITIKHIQNKECTIDSEKITFIDGVDISNYVDTDNDGYPDVIENKYNTDSNDKTKYPNENIVSKEEYYFEEVEITRNEISNIPKLLPNMTPVIWDESGNIVDTTKDDINWYSYEVSDKKWANARTEDGSLWVWIPRYAYKISKGYHSSTAGVIDVKFLRDNTNVAFDGTTAEEVNQGNNPGSKDKFVTHPAFKFGDTELTGIWVAKFEASQNNGNVQILPNKVAWRNITISTMFTNSRSIETNKVYGFDTTGNNVDTHLMKNTEWGAIAYLSWSTYGVNSEIYINNSSTFITGCSSTNVSGTAYAGCINEYNTVKGYNASTTKNVYGVYDMSGGQYENVAAYIKGGSSSLLNTNAKALVDAEAKYKDVYEGSSTTATTNYNANSLYYGDAMYETSSSGDSTSLAWNSDYSTFPINTTPLIARGMYYSLTTGAGSFSFHRVYGTAVNNITFRPVMLIEPGL